SGQPERAELARLTLRLRLERKHPGRPGWRDRVRALLSAGVRPCVPERVSSTGMRFALGPPGGFRMGAPRQEEGRSANERLWDVELTRPFWLGVLQVTQAEYQGLMGTNPSWYSPNGGGEDRVVGLDTTRFPVENVSWDETVEFCRRLSDLRPEKAAGWVYRLPTEAEWEYACRAAAGD